jgi:hypothetical protein
MYYGSDIFIQGHYARFFIPKKCLIRVNDLGFYVHRITLEEERTIADKKEFKERQK